MNQQFLELEWGDGFPLVPPTPRKVMRILAGTTPEQFAALIKSELGMYTKLIKDAGIRIEEIRR